MSEEQEDRKLPSGYSTPMWNFGSSISLLTDPQELLTKLEMYLRNVRKNSRGEIIKLGEPRLNNQGVNDIIGMITSITNQPAILSNFEKFEIESLMEYLSDTLNQSLMVNRINYGIKNQTDKLLINQAVMTVAYVTLKRAYGEGERKFWKGSVQEIKSTIENQNNKNSIFSRLNPFNRN